MLIDRDTTSRVLTTAVANLSLANNLERVSMIVTEAARALTGSDGTTFVVREGQQCFYVDENATFPVLKGKKFPLEGCWRATYRPTEKEVYALEVLANAAAITIENLMLRRAIVQQQTTLPKSFTMWPFQVDIATQRISLLKESEAPEVLNLTPTESKLLIHFMQHEGAVFSREMLVKIIWGESTHVTINTIDTHLSALRRKIGDASKLIKNVRGKGFCFRRAPEKTGLLPETRLSHSIVA